MATVRMSRAGLEALKKSPAIADKLGVEADKVKARVKAPSKFEIISRRGIASGGKYGEAYSQVIMRGRGAIAVEFGTRKTPALAPLRKALGQNVLATRVTV